MRNTLYRDFFEAVGNTPTVYWGKYRDADIYMKLEGENPSGSLKDRTASAIVKHALENNELDSKVLIDSSSGSYGCALAYYGNLANVPVEVVVNAKASAANIAFMEMFGAKVERHGEITRHGYEYILEMLTTQSDKYYFTDQLNNQLSPMAHFSGTGPEILRDIPDVSTVVASMGSGATLLGVGKHMRLKDRDVRMIASVAKPGRKITGTYSEEDYLSPFIREIKEQSLVENYMPVSYDEAIDTAKALIAKGFIVGPQTGGVFKAAIDAIDTYGISGNMLLISGDTGWKNVDKYLEKS